MLSNMKYLAVVAAALTGVSALPEANAKASCPVLHAGTTTLNVAGPGGTSTVYSATAVVDRDINCNGYSNLFLHTTGPAPTKTVRARGTLQTNIAICAATRIPANCPTGPCPSSKAGQTTVRLAGPGLTSTIYARTLIEPVFTNCNGYNSLTVQFTGPSPVTTTTCPETVTSAAYACASSTSVRGC